MLTCHMSPSVSGTALFSRRVRSRAAEAGSEPYTLLASMKDVRELNCSLKMYYSSPHNKSQVLIPQTQCMLNTAPRALLSTLDPHIF